MIELRFVGTDWLHVIGLAGQKVAKFRRSPVGYELFKAFLRGLAVYHFVDKAHTCYDVKISGQWRQIRNVNGMTEIIEKVATPIWFLRPDRLHYEN